MKRFEHIIAKHIQSKLGGNWIDYLPAIKGWRNLEHDDFSVDNRILERITGIPFLVISVMISGPVWDDGRIIGDFSCAGEKFTSKKPRKNKSPSFIDGDGTLT